ncbi:MAG TPA: hypothetical protein VFY68_12800, partial [Nitrososphaeraceae archaeon]|nr:hypothetical protein [Nitrososphaeraceae archaeon]
NDNRIWEIKQKCGYISNIYVDATTEIMKTNPDGSTITKNPDDNTIITRNKEWIKIVRCKRTC